MIFQTIIFLLFFNPFPLFAEPNLPRASIDEELTAARERLEAFNQGLSFKERKILNATRVSEKQNLSPSLRRLYDERQDLKRKLEHWDDVVHLKKEILSLPVAPGGPELDRRRRETEADRIARMAIDGFSELRGKYEMIRPALFHNLLVNMKIKGEGLCWQWARDMIIRLKTLDLKEYDLHWASAREGTIREHNTVVVSSRGMPLEEGLFLDGWKYSGKPFWMRVKEDKKHPWKPGRPYGLE